MIVFTIIHSLSVVAWIVYLMTGVALRNYKDWLPERVLDVSQMLWSHTKWPALASIPILYIGSAVFSTLDIWDAAILPLKVWLWWYYRNSGDDDSWKRKAKKLAEKIAEVDGKLTVVPANA